MTTTGVKKVNIIGVELDEPLDESGFHHVAATVGARLGAHRIGASVYEAEPGCRSGRTTTTTGSRSGCT
jgi:uncharacterized cupin superfamily protein